MKLSPILLVATLTIAAAFTSLPGCHPNAGGPGDGRLLVVCTTGPVAELARHVGGGRVHVEALMGPGVDPHLYQALPADVARLNAADVVFYNGMHLEGRMADLLGQLGRRKPVWAVTDVLRERHAERLRPLPGAEADFDPHVWFDVALWAACAGSVADKLAEVEPAHADDYHRNAARYQADLHELDQWCREQLASIPKQQRVLVTAHDAFGYFGAAYDVEVRGIQGMSTADEADLASVNRLVELLATRGIKAVFVETSVSERNIRALIEASAARGHEVRIGGKLYSDAMGPADSPAGTYTGMVRHNVRTIVEALR
ncbi:MAG: zinc ABC transporter substrate-binding protein [Thermoguttaceae bacterium]|jgi:manganese/zinc/iron transport system substrate-binding protein|nr:zinc ABC transporter substrate-binding protein [Thermoguttaceae bacterium]